MAKWRGQTGRSATSCTPIAPTTKKTGHNSSYGQNMCKIPSGIQQPSSHCSSVSWGTNQSGTSLYLPFQNPTMHKQTQQVYKLELPHRRRLAPSFQVSHLIPVTPGHRRHSPPPGHQRWTSLRHQGNHGLMAQRISYSTLLNRRIMDLKRDARSQLTGRREFMFLVDHLCGVWHCFCNMYWSWLQLSKKLTTCSLQRLHPYLSPWKCIGVPNEVFSVVVSLK